MFLESLEKCRLAIGSYPHFEYDATGGGGQSSLVNTEKVSFDPKSFHIPPLNWKTTKILGIPMPPGLEIQMELKKLEGSVCRSSGEIELDFESIFKFSLFSLFHFPDLIVKTSLGTGKVKSKLHQVQGKRIQSNGKATIVGVAIIPPTKNIFLDIFLGLPNEALAVLECNIKDSKKK